MFATCKKTLLATIMLTMATPALAAWDKIIRDWEIYCDAALNCTFSTYNNKSPVNTLTLRRSAEPNAMLELEIMVPEAIGRAKTMQIVSDSKTGKILFDFASEGREGKERAWKFNGPAIVKQLLPAMKKGRQLSLIVEGDSAITSGAFSLSGFTAALLYVDEVQGRVGRTDALQAKGSKPPNAAVPPRAINKFADVPPAVLQIWKSLPDDCGDIPEDMFGNMDAFSDRIGKDQNLIALPCNFPGAYNAFYTLFVANDKGDRAQLAALPGMVPEGPIASNGAFNIRWNRNKRILTAFYRGRGIGDCGSFETWKLGERGGFILLESRQKDDCDGSDLPREKWPLIWPPE